jgi:hypothetical protein
VAFAPASSRKQGTELAAHESGTKNADAHVLSVWPDLNDLGDSTFLGNAFLASHLGPAKLLKLR